MHNGRKERKTDGRTRTESLLAGSSLYRRSEISSLHFLEQIVHFCGSTAHALEELTTATAEEKRDERARVMIFLKPLWRISLFSLSLSLSFAVKHDNKRVGQQRLTNNRRRVSEWLSDDVWRLLTREAQADAYVRRPEIKAFLAERRPTLGF